MTESSTLIVQIKIASASDNGNLNRSAKVFVLEADFDRAQQLFYAELEDEL